MAMKPKKVSSAAKKPVKRMRGGGMVAMKKGGAVGAASGAAAGGAIASFITGAGTIKSALRGSPQFNKLVDSGAAPVSSIPKSVLKGLAGAGAGAGAGSPKSRKSDPNKPDKKMRGRAKTKGRGPT